MHIIKKLLMAISIACICFLLFAMIYIVQHKEVILYEFGFATLAIVCCVLNLKYHGKSISFYNFNKRQKISKIWLLIPLLFTGFFFWLSGEIMFFLATKMGQVEFTNYLFDIVAGVAFIGIAVISAIELITTYKNMKNEIDSIQTSAL